MTETAPEPEATEPETAPDGEETAEEVERKDVNIEGPTATSGGGSNPPPATPEDTGYSNHPA